MGKILRRQDGTSMLFAMVLFVIMTVFGLSLLNAVHAGLTDTRREMEKEQTLLYISSLYDVVNGMVEDGKFNAGDAVAPDTKATAVIQDGNGNDIDVRIEFKEVDPMEAKVEITHEGSTYSIKTYYNKKPAGDGYVRKYCGRLEKKR